MTFKDKKICEFCAYVEKVNFNDVDYYLGCVLTEDVVDDTGTCTKYKKKNSKEEVEDKQKTNITPQYKPHKFQRTGYYKGN